MPALHLTPTVTTFSSRAAVQMASAVLARDGRAIVIDPGILPDELDAIAGFLSDARLTVDAVVFTHAHWDHIGGAGRWPDARVLAHPDFPAWLRRCEAEEPLNDARSRTWTRFGLPVPAPLALPHPEPILRDGALVPLGPTAARVLELPGHLGGSIGLELDEVVVCGDLLDSVELPLPLQDPWAYLVSLDRIDARLQAGIEHIVPGHGPPLPRARALAQVAQDRVYVQSLLATAEEAVTRGWEGDEAWAAFAALPWFGKGDPDRDGEHRLNATEVLRMYRIRRGG